MNDARSERHSTLNEVTQRRTHPDKSAAWRCRRSCPRSARSSCRSCCCDKRDSRPSCCCTLRCSRCSSTECTCPFRESRASRSGTAHIWRHEITLVRRFPKSTKCFNSQWLGNRITATDMTRPTRSGTAPKALLSATLAIYHSCSDLPTIESSVCTTYSLQTAPV